MNIVSVNYEDLAGLSYNRCTAINMLTDHHATSISMISNWIRYPQMIAGKKSIAKVMPEIIRNADVLHINERPMLLRFMGAKPEDWKGKKIIYHFHGSRFRRGAPGILKSIRSEFSDVTYLVSTPNLLQFIPEGTWFPAVIPIEKYREKYPMRRNDPPKLYAAHTKPRRHRGILVLAAKQLKEEGLEFETEWIGGKMHVYNLEHKAQADIYLNGMKPFYGIDVLEASAFEMPCVTGMNKFSREYMLKHEIDCPYIIVDNFDQLKDAIRQLVLDRWWREEEGRRSYEYVKAMHSPEISVERFLEMVE